MINRSNFFFKQRKRFFVLGMFFFAGIVALGASDNCKAEVNKEKLIQIIHKIEVYSRDASVDKAKTTVVTGEDIQFVCDAFQEEAATGVRPPFTEREVQNGKLTVVGDVHGNLESAIATAELANDSERLVVYTGDYVDRGDNSVETAVYLMAKQLLHKNILLLRGNHELFFVNGQYGLKSELSQKDLFGFLGVFNDTFGYFPVSALITSGQNHYFLCHGGIGPDINLELLKGLNFPIGEVGYEKIEDLLWSDPNKNVDEFKYNKYRAQGKYYGKQNLLKFCKEFLINHEKFNGQEIKGIIRGHEHGGSENALETADNLGNSYFCKTVISGEQILGADSCPIGEKARVLNLLENGSLEFQKIADVKGNSKALKGEALSELPTQQAQQAPAVTKEEVEKWFREQRKNGHSDDAILSHLQQNGFTIHFNFANQLIQEEQAAAVQKQREIGELYQGWRIQTTSAEEILNWIDANRNDLAYQGTLHLDSDFEAYVKERVNEEQAASRVKELAEFLSEEKKIDELFEEAKKVTDFDVLREISGKYQALKAKVPTFDTSRLYMLNYKAAEANRVFYTELAKQEKQAALEEVYQFLIEQGWNCESILSNISNWKTMQECQGQLYATDEFEAYVQQKSGEQLLQAMDLSLFL